MSDTSAMLLSEIESDIQSVEGDLMLSEETNFESRADALDFIDFHIVDRIQDLQQTEELAALKKRAENIKCNLEKIDTNLFEQLREKIRTGTCTQSSFIEKVRKYIKADIHIQSKVGYDNLDVFINGLLSNQTIPEATTELQPEMVFYQKTPARIIFELAKRADLKKDEVFFDIGSGLGQVPILMNLITGVTTKGVEYEPAYYDYAKIGASQLNLPNVEFINIDARCADYSHGITFFMYTPFEGDMLRQMLEILHKESRKRTIRIFTYGPCSSEVARHNWLNCVNGNDKPDDPYQLYEFRSLCE